LTGRDPQTRKDWSHRKELIRLRIEVLASVFAIDVCDHTVLDNHLHLILRNRPDIVTGWSDEEVARRYLRLNHSDLDLRDEPRQERIDDLVADKEKLAAARHALSSISEFMKQLKCSVAVVCNAEDGCSGCFWQSRFVSERLVDDARLLVCSLYVNLDPIRAGLARDIDDAEYTSTYQRLCDERSASPEAHADPSKSDESRREVRPNSGYLAAMSLDGDGYDGVEARRRASNEGYLGLKLADYVELLESIVRRERAERDGGELLEYSPILVRMGVGRAQWEHALRRIGRRFSRELAIMADMYEEARQRE
jgi:REP element-mobilizing transposase RayT